MREVNYRPPSSKKLQAVEKWDGKLPTTMVPSTALPFINLQPAGNAN